MTSFIVACEETGYGDNVYVKGDCPELGHWRDGMVLQTSEKLWPIWWSEPVRLRDKVVQCKLVVKRACGEEIWEDLPNRCLQIDHCRHGSSFVIMVYGNSDQEGPRPLQQPNIERLWWQIKACCDEGHTLQLFRARYNGFDLVEESNEDMQYECPIETCCDISDCPIDDHPRSSVLMHQSLERDAAVASQNGHRCGKDAPSQVETPHDGCANLQQAPVAVQDRERCINNEKWKHSNDLHHFDPICEEVFPSSPESLDATTALQGQVFPSKREPAIQVVDETVHESQQHHRPHTQNFGYDVAWMHLETNSNSWQRLAAVANQRAEHAYCNRLPMVDVQIGNRTCSLCFDDMLLWSMSTGEKQRLMRKLEPPRQLAMMLHPCIKNISFREVGHVRQQRPIHLHDDLETSLISLVKHYSRQLREMQTAHCQAFLTLPVWREVDADAMLVFAALSVAIFTVCPFGIALALGYDWASEPFKEAYVQLCGQADQKEEANADVLSLELSAQDDGYGWLSRSMSIHSRLMRLAAACRACIAARGCSKIPQMLQDTHILDCDHLQGLAPPRSRGLWTQFYCEDDKKVLDVACDACCRGHHVAVVSAASAYHAGGGFLTGGRHALEEALCMQSTLYFSLALAVQMADARLLKDQSRRELHIPENGCVLSPHVEVLRFGTEHGYTQCSPFCLAAVLSIAMPNKNRCVRDSPLDVRPKREYMWLLTKKFEAAVRGAIIANANVLVIPDCGCGVFRNDPVDVGRALGQVLRKFRGHFDEVILVGNPKFTTQAKHEATRCGATSSNHTHGYDGKSLRRNDDQQSAWFFFDISEWMSM